MARFQIAPGPVPLHHQVYQDLRAALDDREWAAGDRLPTERELARRYGCSLITVRRALDELRREHRLTRTQAAGLEPETRTVTARKEPASERVAQALGLRLGAPTIYLERLRIASSEPLLLEQAHLPGVRLRGLLEHDLEANSLYEILASRYGAQVVRTRETIEPVLLPPREGRLLGHVQSRLALLLVGVAFTASDEPIEYSETFVRSDRTKFRIDTTPVRDGSSLHQLQFTDAASGRS